jgi:hypothetical protein
MKATGSVIFLILLSACGGHSVVTEHVGLETRPERLPQPLANHALTTVGQGDQWQLFSFNGLRSGKTHNDITNQATVWYQGQWQTMTTPASQPPVLASVAVTVGEMVYLFGGYTVAADHTEVSVPNVWRIDPQTQQWQALPAMPTPVDDTVALVHQERFIYLISGWHDVDNVNLVQVFDTVNLNWQQATPIPFPAVFGHAGAMLDGVMVICDGVKVLWQGDKKSFHASPVCAKGVIDEHDPVQITWQAIEHHSGVAYYRMAANDDGGQQLIFAAGSDNPYNYNGIGYDGRPSAPSGDVRIYHLKTGQWSILQNHITPSMDHRNLLRKGHRWLIAGGMRAGQTVVDDIEYFSIAE